MRLGHLKSFPIWYLLVIKHYFVIKPNLITQLCLVTINHFRWNPLPQPKCSFTIVIKRWLNQLATKNHSWDYGGKWQKVFYPLAVGWRCVGTTWACFLKGHEGQGGKYLCPRKQQGGVCELLPGWRVLWLSFLCSHSPLHTLCSNHTETICPSLRLSCFL